MSLVKWVDGYYDHKADVPLEKIGDGKNLEFLPLAVVTLEDLREVVEGLQRINELAAHNHTGAFDPVNWLVRIHEESKHLLAKLEGAK